VPFEVANKVSTKVVIAFDGVQSQPATIPVTTAFPGLYTADGSGQGEVLAINEDGTVNSASNPAAGGSVVSVYVSGAGQTNPAGVDGLITGTPPPLVAQAVSILVDNQQAKVTYAGDIPQFAAGAVQVNFVVPSGLTPGNASILLTEPGGASSQASVVLAVK